MSSPYVSIFCILVLFVPSSALDFLFNSFSTADLTLIGDATIQSPVIRLTNDSNQFSFGRAFYSTQVPIIRKPASSNLNSSSFSSFSTSFVFSILPEISTSPGFGFCFVLSNSTLINGALSGQYFGLFTNATNPPPAPLLAVEFDTGQNPELNDPDGNHVGIDLNNIESIVTESAGFYNSSGGKVDVPMRSGENIVAWIDFDGNQLKINVTIAPVGVPKPEKPLLSFKDPVIADYLSDDMFVGFSASKTQWVEQQRILAWSFSDTGVAREINTTGLPVFMLQSSSKRISAGVIAAIVVACSVIVLFCLLVGFWFWKRRHQSSEEDEIEDWELEYWPHRISFDELYQATDGFSKESLIGIGGFGRVYKGRLANETEVAVKCVNHDSKQGLREFMAEISSMGRLQHKNLVQMRGWCRKGNELILVYDYMPNKSLNGWIFDVPKRLLDWKERRRILKDIAEGLNYLHCGWDQVVLHRDVKSSNVLLDADMRGRLGDFGLAKLYQHGEVPNTTRVVGTIGYLAPELATRASPTIASDVYSFGVVVLEVMCGRRPIETSLGEEEAVLIDWVKEKYKTGSLLDVVDKRINGDYPLDDMEKLLKLGLACCHPDPECRPDMEEVVLALGGEEVESAAPGVVLSDLAVGT